MKTAPSKKNLIETFRMDDETAAKIRGAWKDSWKSDTVEKLWPLIESKHKLHHGFVESKRYARQLAIDVLGEFHGVEYLGKNRNGEYVDFLNSGDSYAPSLFFVGDRMFISTCGDLIERGYIKEY